MQGSAAKNSEEPTFERPEYTSHQNHEAAGNGVVRPFTVAFADQSPRNPELATAAEVAVSESHAKAETGGESRP
jgi:hypothetical protein